MASAYSWESGDGSSIYLEINKATYFIGECNNYDPPKNSALREKCPDFLGQPSQEATSKWMSVAIKYIFFQCISSFSLKQNQNKQNNPTNKQKNQPMNNNKKPNQMWEGILGKEKAKNSQVSRYLVTVCIFWLTVHGFTEAQSSYTKFGARDEWVQPLSPVVPQSIYMLLLQSIKNWATCSTKFQKSCHGKSCNCQFWQMMHHRNERRRLNLELGCTSSYLPFW